MNVGITCYPTYGGSGIVATELGHGARQARARGPLHHLREPDPAGSGHAAHPLSRSGSLQLSAVPISAVLPGAGVAHGGSGGELQPGSCCTCTTRFRIPSPRCWRSRCWRRTRRLPFITTLHGTDITLVGADPSYFPITKFSIEKSDGVTSISEYLREQTVEVFGVRERDPRDQQLRELRSVPPGQRKERRGARTRPTARSC